MAKVLKFKKKTPAANADLFDLMIEAFGVNGAIVRAEEAMAQAERDEQQLFGDSDGSDMSDEEMHIIFSDLPHEVKLEQLGVLRAG